MYCTYLSLHFISFVLTIQYSSKTPKKIHTQLHTGRPFMATTFFTTDHHGLSHINFLLQIVSEDFHFAWHIKYSCNFLISHRSPRCPWEERHPAVRGRAELQGETNRRAGGDRGERGPHVSGGPCRAEDGRAGRRGAQAAHCYHRGHGRHKAPRWALQRKFDSCHDLTHIISRSHSPYLSII